MMKWIFKKTFSAFGYVLVLLEVLSLTACATDTPYLDSKFGEATQEAYQNQSIDNRGINSNDQMSARELRVPMDNYLKGNNAPAGLQGVVTNSGGLPASR